MNAHDVADLDALGRLQAEAHLEQAELLHRQIKRLEKALHPHLVPDADVQRLLRVPGVGKAVAFTIRLEVDDVARFPTERQFFSYCRVVPGADNSGGRTRHKRSRDGNRYLKLAFSHAAVRALQYYPEVRGWYRQKARKKPDVVARTLVAKEIARIADHVLKKEEDFNGRFKGSALSRVKQEQWPLLPSPAGITGDGEGTQTEPPRPPSAGMGGEERTARSSRRQRSGTTRGTAYGPRVRGRSGCESPYGGVARQRSVPPITAGSR